MSRLSLFINPNELPLTDEMVAKAEAALKLRLPESYLRVMRVCNGGSLRQNAFPVGNLKNDSGNFIGIYDLMPIGEIETKGSYLIEEWDYPSPGVILTCDGHTAALLDYRSCGPEGEPSVLFVDTEEVEDKQELQLAPDFDTFINKLVYSCPTYEVGIIAKPVVDYELESVFEKLGEVEYSRPFNSWTIKAPLFHNNEGDVATILIRRNHHYDDSGWIYYEFSECIWIASLNVMPTEASALIESFNQQVKDRLGGKIVLIHDPLNFEN